MRLSVHINTIYGVICITDQATVNTYIENVLDLSYSVDMLDRTNSHRNGLFKIKCMSFLIVIRYFFSRNQVYLF